MVVCAEFLGRDKSTCTRGEACICKKQAGQKPIKKEWLECCTCKGAWVLRDYDFTHQCHECDGEGGSWQN